MLALELGASGMTALVLASQQISSTQSAVSVRFETGAKLVRQAMTRSGLGIVEISA